MNWLQYITLNVSGKGSQRERSARITPCSFKKKKKKKSSNIHLQFSLKAACPSCNTPKKNLISRALYHHLFSSFASWFKWSLSCNIVIVYAVRETLSGAVVCVVWFTEPSLKVRAHWGSYSTALSEADMSNNTEGTVHEIPLIDLTCTQWLKLPKDFLKKGHTLCFSDQTLCVIYCGWTALSSAHEKDWFVMACWVQAILVDNADAIRSKPAHIIFCIFMHENQPKAQ